MTIEPHLHRYKELNEIYSITSFSLQATDNIANWIKIHISNPIIIGPDSESKLWVEKIANKIQSPCLILEKIRHGDKEVEIKIPNVQNYRNYTPVLVDDIISTGRTMLAAIKLLADLEFPPPVCIGVHAIFSANAYDELSKIRGIRIITCNTINHITNEIDVSDQFIEKLRSS
jgi:ribose-phosphate pyrophosphokinase